ncbi:MAG: V-type ATP synthase subunit F [Thermoplasmata archaeon]|nr:MAG: V-type ATP synthase subunit F [Thermoplasmata archaeon]
MESSCGGEMKIVAVGDEDTVTLFRFLGIEGYVADENLHKNFKDIVAREDIAVVIITEKVADKLMDEITYIKLQKDLPIIVEIPDKKGKIKEREDSIARLIKRAVGVEIEK